MIKYDTYVCNVCKKAQKVSVNPSGFSAFARCVITRNCDGIMNSVPNMFVADEQYHTNISVDAWIKHPQIYDHQQTASRTVWTINHNLGANVVIRVLVHNTLGELEPIWDFSIVKNSSTCTIIEFSSNYTGIAMCTARPASSIDKVMEAEPAAPTLLSINNTIVIATKIASAVIIELSVQPNPLRPSDIVQLTANVNPSSHTPWVGASYVVIANQRYHIRHVDISNVLLFHRAAATFFANAVNGKAIGRGETFILLSNPPYHQTPDRNLESVVDLVDLSISKQSNTILTQSGLLCNPDALSPVYPLMKVD